MLSDAPARPAALAAPPSARWRGPGLAALIARPAALLALAALLGVGLATLAAPALTPYDPLKRNIAVRLQPPSPAHPLGTDALGRDLLARLLYGGRASLAVGLLAVTGMGLVGIPLGLAAGYFGGAIDHLIMRAMDLILTFPSLIFAIWLVAMLGPGLQNVLLALCIFGVPAYARVARASTLAARDADYVTAARCLGVGHVRIVVRHILPNIAGPLIVLATLNLSGAILQGAGLSFLGLGVRPPMPEWGAMLADGRAYLGTAWWLTVFPGLAITTVVLAANVAGDALRDALDPRLRRG